MDEKNYYFSDGLPGFESFRIFRVIPEPETYLAQLISIDDEKIGFILINAEVMGEYFEKVKNQQEVLTELNIVNQENLQIWLIVTLNALDAEQITVNLRAPILLNSEKNIGKQLILYDEQYPLKHPLISQKNNVVVLEEGVVK
jgi:flagellar assembly factor FliW